MTQSNKSTGELFFRGCAWGLLFSLPIWAAMYWLLWLIFG